MALATFMHIDRRSIANVLVVLGASRSGSSLLFHLLARSGGFLSPMGEETPFYRTLSVGNVRRPEDSDRVLPETLGAELVESLGSRIADDLAEPWDGTTPLPKDSFLADCLKRVGFQDPEFDLKKGQAILSALLDQSPPRSPEESPKFWRAALERLVAGGFRSSVGLHDFSETPDRAFSSEAPRARLEEPPFVVPFPRLAAGKDAARKTVLLKSTSNCYRMELVRALFPAARVRVVHLSRNPAASINALIDGWCSNAFHSHDVGKIRALRISGYTSPERPGSDSWWKFDLPPGWSAFADAALEDVCAFQWRSANEHALEASRDAETLRICHESVLESTSTALARIREFAGVTGAARLPDRNPVVMAVRRPAAGRWREREDRILPRLRDPKTAAVAKELGYELTRLETWS